MKIGKKQFVSSSERGVQQGSVWSPILLLINGPSSMPACKVKFGHLCEQFLATLVVPYMPMTFVYTLPAAFSLWKHRSPWCNKKANYNFLKLNMGMSEVIVFSNDRSATSIECS